MYGWSCIRSWNPRQTRERPGELNVHSFVALKGGEKEGKMRAVERVRTRRSLLTRVKTTKVGLLMGEGCSKDNVRQ